MSGARSRRSVSATNPSGEPPFSTAACPAGIHGASAATASFAPTESGAVASPAFPVESAAVGDLTYMTFSATGKGAASPSAT